MAKIVLLGEAWGEHEERERTPFVGPTGYLLHEMLTEAGIHPTECYKTNVFNLRPVGNRIETLCGPKEGGLRGYPSLLPGRYVQAEYQSELDRLFEELNEVAPNVVVAFGNTALWALTGMNNIGTQRGFTYLSEYGPVGLKVLPTYHPAAALRLWELRSIVVMDLRKAKRESEFKKLRRPQREVWIEPTLEDLERFYEQYIVGCKILSVDIETSGRLVTCIGFAPRSDVSLVIPFYDSRGKGKSYWPDVESEAEALGFASRVLDTPLPKLFQNGLYDIAFLHRAWETPVGTVRVNVRNAAEDTMLLHHALQPESLKGLGFLGSVYTNEQNWKQMRERSTRTIKPDN